MAANWKMHKSSQEAKNTFKELVESVGALPSDREVAIFPTFTSLAACQELLTEGYFLGGQNFYPADKGAYTGEISASMLKDLGCTMVLVGHSERRSIFDEDHEFLAKKAAVAIENGLFTVFCVGESLEERQKGKLAQVLKKQLSALPEKIAGLADKFCVAYEPVWAIGTGEVAGKNEIIEAHGMLRAFLKEIYGPSAEKVRILYGGSVNPDNVQEIINLDNVNGVLVGGASLNADSFKKIVLA